MTEAAAAQDPAAAGPGPPLLLRVALPPAAAALLAARCPGAVLARLRDPVLGLGLVLPLLARTPPFSRAPLGLRVPLTAGELARGHHLLVLREGRQPVAYAGWAACSAEEARRFLGPEGIRALDPARRDGEALAFLTLTAVDAAAFAALEVGLRTLLAGRRYVARRSHAARDGARAVVPRGGVLTPMASLRPDVAVVEA